MLIIVIAVRITPDLPTAIVESPASFEPIPPPVLPQDVVKHQRINLACISAWRASRDRHISDAIRSESVIEYAFLGGRQVDPVWR